MCLLQDYQRVKSEEQSIIVRIEEAVRYYANLFDIKDFPLDNFFNDLRSGNLADLFFFGTQGESFCLSYDAAEWPDEHGKTIDLDIPLEFFDHFKDGKLDEGYLKELTDIKAEIADIQWKLLGIDSEIEGLERQMKGRMFSKNEDETWLREVSETRNKIDELKSKKKEMKDRKIQLLDKIGGCE